MAAPRARCFAQSRVDRFGGADVDAAGGMDGDDQTGLTGELAGEQELLLVSAGERAQFCPTARRLHVVIGDEAVGEGGDRLVREKRTAAQRRPRIIAQDGVLGEVHAADQPCCQAVLGDMRDARAGDLRRRPVGHRLAVDPDGPVGRGPEPGHDLGELTLSIAGDARDTERFARADLEIDIPQRGHSFVARGR